MAKEPIRGKCVECGKEFINSHPNAICCSNDCRKERQRKRSKKAQQVYKAKKAVEKEIAQSKEKLWEIDRKARALGMSYGKYIAYIENQH